MGRLAVETSRPPGGAVGWTPWNPYGRIDWYETVEFHADDFAWWMYHGGDLARLRAHLAAASDSEYVAAADQVATMRATGSIRARLISSYLLPQRQDWVEADLADPMTVGLSRELTRLLVPAATTAAQLDRIAQLTGGAPLDSILFGKAHLYNMVCQVGPTSAPAVAALLDSCRTVKDRQFVAGILAQLPSDEAYRALLERSDQPGVATALAKADKRCPRRATRFSESP
ncbi:hypothetical protein ACFVUS_07060 [Nocardia sp. NPDC058058]|uniref:hypothetical protein n=1 Tax=Nocardia sp. NPDC058058 TaxID=3346317 RepID=UPI0036D969CC